jgi:hypothetical protein
MRESENRRARDISLRNFLGLLIWLRTVVVQDAAVLYTRHPSASLFQYPPFNTQPFHDFAATATNVIAKAERDVALALEKLPENIAKTFSATMSRLAIDQQLERESSKAYHDEMKSQITFLQGLVEDVAQGHARPRKRRKQGHAGEFTAYSFAYS